jgi:hypothetical protein
MTQINCRKVDDVDKHDRDDFQSSARGHVSSAICVRVFACFAESLLTLAQFSAEVEAAIKDLQDEAKRG